jgi:hypothetical protein
MADPSAEGAKWEMLIGNDNPWVQSFRAFDAETHRANLTSSEH